MKRTTESQRAVRAPSLADAIVPHATPAVSPAITAGTVISGGCLGHKLSPLSEYIALVLPARIFRLEFAKRGLAPTNLSRLAADSGTVTSALVPWNSCGTFMGAVLGVPTLMYLPYAIFNYVSPVLSVLYGITGFTIEKITPDASEETDAPESNRLNSDTGTHSEETQ